MTDKRQADSELKQNLVAAGKIGGFMIALIALLFLFILIGLFAMVSNP
jgi:hypothetical protein